MRVWRLAKTRYARDLAVMLSGAGAAERGGRWNPPGVPAVYCSENSSLALLEILAGLPFGVDRPEYRIVDLVVPDERIERLDVLPEETDSPRLGGEALRRCLAIAVPSAVNPLDRNIVINPRHPHFREVEAGAIRTFRLDERLR